MLLMMGVDDSGVARWEDVLSYYYHLIWEKTDDVFAAVLVEMETADTTAAGA